MTAPCTRRSLVARLDNDGDVLLAGPAVRAVAAGSDSVTVLCGPRGEQAARLLPGVDDVVVWRAPWIDPQPEPVRRDDVERLVDAVRERGIGTGVLLTSFHQSALPLALVLRLAGVPFLAAVSADYPGSLLDVRLPEPGDVPEAERGLAIARAAGFALPRHDDGRLAVREPLPDVEDLVGGGPYVVVHPGTSAPARAYPVPRWREAVAALTAAGRRVVVTGGPAEAALTADVAGSLAVDLGARTSLPRLAAVCARADAVVVANTGPAHLAAAVGTPVVSLFAPTVPRARWAPYRVPRALLGDAGAACAGSRATVCPVPGHPCLSSVTAAEVVAAVDRLAPRTAEEPGRTHRRAEAEVSA